MSAARGGRRPPFELTIGTRFELGLSWLTPALDTLRRVQPDRTVHLTFGDSPALVERTRRGELDATVTSARLAGAPLAYALLHEERYAFVAHPEVELGDWREAENHTLVDAAEDLPLFRYFLDARPAREVWNFARVERLGAIAAIHYRVLQRSGVAVLPRYLIREDLASGALRELFPKTRLARDHFRLVWRAGHPLASELHELAAHLREVPLR